MNSGTVIFLSYDGMTDPLGASQILPYLEGLASRGHHITVVSFEKPVRFITQRDAVANRLLKGGIRWVPLRYTKRPPILSKVWDLLIFFLTTAHLILRYHVIGIHCRSYIPTLVGFALGRLTGVPFIFDMRGFWADERVDGQLWNLGSPFSRFIYSAFKFLERQFLISAKATVCLTEAARVTIQSWNLDSSNPPVVIPCCVDLVRFTPSIRDSQSTPNIRRQLGIPEDAQVMVYSGSFGTWYLLKEMLDFFAVVAHEHPRSHLLLLSQDAGEFPWDSLVLRGVPRNRVTAASLSPSEVPRALSECAIALYFIRPCFSKTGSSPTKLGEFLAMGLPVISNAGIGDTDRIIESSGAGHLIPEFNTHAYTKASALIPALCAKDRGSIRAVAQREFSLISAVDQYDKLYLASFNSQL